jgi:hypothetical protein
VPSVQCSAGTNDKDAEVATRAILQTPGIWGAVTAVAEALLRQNVLTWDEVRAVMGDSGLQDPCSGPCGAVAYTVCATEAARSRPPTQPHAL